MRPLGLVAVLVVLTACTDAGSGPEPTAAPTGTRTATATTSSPTPDATGATGESTSAGGWDCEAVEEAREDLAQATNDELSRLEIDRSDPRAFGVQVLVAAQRGLEYWSMIRDAIPADEAALRADADEVVQYWSSVDADLDTIDVRSGDDAALAAATQHYLEVMAEHPETVVLPVQERLTAGVESACATPTS